MPDISKAYEPQAVESKWYQYWLDHQLFTADPARVSAKRPAYSIVIPPPNVTGVLTLGHVLNNTIQDILARKARMEGKEVLWLPGTDHAGIATENVVTRQIRKEEQKTKQELGRDEFLKRVWTWKEKHGGIILQQLRALGASCDWTRTRFTMDDDYVRCVMKVFVDLYQKGLIYRGKRMVNWCPATLTALSDEEVVMKEQNGLLYYFKVEVAGAPGRFLTIATTRPETIPGDTAVAVNPKDPRYASLIGQHIVRPLPAELPRDKKLIPIIGDDHVDFEFGTGVLKVTPAHDKADFEIGQRHQLAVVDIMNPNGSMNALAGQDLSGLDRFAARKVAVEKLRELGALDKEEPYKNNIGYSERADVPIEPRLSEQWFLKYPSAEASRKVVADGRMKFFPERWAKVYDHWMGNIQDWCISRQLWWGHRIPVWRQGSSTDSLLHAESQGFNLEEYLIQITKEDPDGIVYRRHPTGEVVPTAHQIIRFVAIAPGREPIVRKLEEFGFTRDPDVLDTWFSSWLWPFATMCWTGDKDTDAKNPTLTAFYPTTDLVTGPDIIFFWVARMIMAGYEYRGEMPFRNVYYTGIIRDKQGRKMSKSLGNSPDPLDLIKLYGADALRFGVMRSAPLGQDILFDEQHVELGRNFCNKLWNACRFRQMQGGEVQGEIDPNRLRSDDKWILLKLHAALKELGAAFAEYKFSDAAATLYRFFWSEYCDWYVESTKAVLNLPVEAQTPPHPACAAEAPARRRPGPLPPVGRGGEGESAPTPPLSNASTNAAVARRANVLAVMDFVLSHTLRMFHPFLPFITEELWQAMGYSQDMPAEQGGRTIMQAPWPRPFGAELRDHYSLDDCYLEFVEARHETVTRGRNLRREANIASNKKARFVLKPGRDFPPGDLEVLRILLNAEPLDVDSNYAPPKGTPAAVTPMGELFLPLEGMIDVAAEVARLEKELEKFLGEIAKVQDKLNNPAFVQKAPPPVLADHQKRLAEWQARHEQTKKLLDGLKG